MQDFEIDEILQNVSSGSPYIFSDFDNDRKLEYITVEANVNTANTETKISFHLYELTSEILQYDNEKIYAGPNLKFPELKTITFTQIIKQVNFCLWNRT